MLNNFRTNDSVRHNCQYCVYIFARLIFAQAKLSKNILTMKYSRITVVCNVTINVVCGVCFQILRLSCEAGKPIGSEQLCLCPLQNLSIIIIITRSWGSLYSPPTTCILSVVQSQSFRSVSFIVLVIANIIICIFRSWPKRMQPWDTLQLQWIV